MKKIAAITMIALVLAVSGMSLPFSGYVGFAWADGDGGSE